MQLRDLIDIAWIEDLAGGLARASGLRVCVFDADGTLIVASASNNDFARLTGHVLGTLPRNLELVPVRAHDPPGQVAFVASRGVWYVAAPVYVDDSAVGYVAVGEFRAEQPPLDEWRTTVGAANPGVEELRRAWETLPALDRSGTGRVVGSARWGARVLAETCRREAHLISATQEAALIGDIADWLTGELDLQMVLDRIVAETARVMHCKACSLRLYDPKTQEMLTKAVYNLPVDAVGTPAVVRMASAVDDEALQGRVVYIEELGSDPRVQDPSVARDRGLVSVLAAGMVYRGKPLGVLRVYTDRKRRFRPAQRNLLHAVANQAAAAISHAQLVDERIRLATTQRQLALAGDLQTRIVRTPPPRHPLLETGLIFEPSYHVAGDFCDFLQLCDGRIAAVVADVVGKGIPASLLMASVRGALRAAADSCQGPGELLTRLNRLVFHDTATNEFLTLLLIALDRDARRLTYCNAGHEPLLLWRDGVVRETEEADLVLGGYPDVQYQEYDLSLQPHDRLVLYTDGACEARNFADEEFGRERLHESVARYAEEGAQTMLDNIRWDIRRFAGLAEQSDDLTLVGVRIKG